MSISRHSLLGTAAAASVLPGTRARGQRSTVKIGVLNDMSGLARDVTGPTDVACVHQAIEEFGSAAWRFDIEVLSADHQQKPDLAASIAREWLDHQGVALVLREEGHIPGEQSSRNWCWVRKQGCHPHELPLIVDCSLEFRARRRP